MLVISVKIFDSSMLGKVVVLNLLITINHN